MSREMSVEAVNVASLVTFADEFVGLQFFGRGGRPKGEFVEARFSGPSARTVDVTFRPSNPGPLGHLDAVTFPTGAMVRVERRRLSISAHDDVQCPYHVPLDDCCADPEGWHDWHRGACDNCGAIKRSRNPCDTESVSEVQALAVMACTCPGFPRLDIDRDCPAHGEVEEWKP